MFTEKFKPFRTQLLCETGHARDVATWPCKTFDQPVYNWIAGRHHDNQNGGGRLLRSERIGRGSDNHDIDMSSRHVGCECRQLVESAFGVLKFNFEILAFDPS